MIDCYEFFRAFAWEDIEHVEDSFADAKLARSSIVALAKERLTVFFGRTRYDARHDAQHISTIRHVRVLQLLVLTHSRMTRALQARRQR